MIRGILKYATLIALALIANSCSKSGKKRFHENRASKISQPPPTNINEKNIVKMTKRNGVYEIPTEVNGEKMYFIFDTGAGMISISNTEAMFLYKQGRLNESDIVGNAKFTDAKGEISDGLVIVLKEVKIGNKILKNVEASIVPNLDAPLLFGQSALEKFGKVSIDYTRNEITFE